MESEICEMRETKRDREKQKLRERDLQKKKREKGESQTASSHAGNAVPDL